MTCPAAGPRARRRPTTRLMLCPVCHGTHVTLVNGRRLPCPECSGMGEIHCCDGLQEQPGEEGVRDQSSEDREESGRGNGTGSGKEEDEQ